VDGFRRTLDRFHEVEVHVIARDLVHLRRRGA
jgi:hypothetical protein